MIIHIKIRAKRVQKASKIKEKSINKSQIKERREDGEK